MIRICLDLHYFWKLDLDPPKSEKLDPDTYQIKNSEALKAQNRAGGAVDAHNGGLEAQSETLEGL